MKAIVLAASLGLLFGTVPAMAGTQSGNGTSGSAAKAHMKSAQANVNAQKHTKSASPSLKSPPAIPMPTGGPKVPPQDRPGQIVPNMEAR